MEKEFKKNLQEDPNKVLLKYHMESFNPIRGIFKGETNTKSDLFKVELFTME